MCASLPPACPDATSQQTLLSSSSSSVCVRGLHYYPAASKQKTTSEAMQMKNVHVHQSTPILCVCVPTVCVCVCHLDHLLALTITSLSSLSMCELVAVASIQTNTHSICVPILCSFRWLKRTRNKVCVCVLNKDKKVPTIYTIYTQYNRCIHPDFIYTTCIKEHVV